MYNFSPNMLKTFKNCPQKYYFQYIEEIRMPQRDFIFTKGKKIHALANYYLRGDDISKLESILSAEEAIIWRNLKNNEYFQKNYVKSEYNLSCKIGEFWIGGRLDALVYDKDSYYILDYKTGSAPKNAEYDFQTMVYLTCLEKSEFKGNHNFVYIDLKNNINLLIKNDKQDEYVELLHDICEQIKHYQPQEHIEHSKRCEFCEYKKICF